jgi:hypothetical protein
MAGLSAAKALVTSFPAAGVIRILSSDAKCHTHADAIALCTKAAEVFNRLCHGNGSASRLPGKRWRMTISSPGHQFAPAVIVGSMPLNRRGTNAICALPSTIATASNDSFLASAAKVHRLDFDYRWRPVEAAGGALASSTLWTSPVVRPSEHPVASTIDRGVRE